MSIIIELIVLIIIGAILCIMDSDLTGPIILIGGGVFLLFAVLALPLNHMGTKAEIAKFKATQQSVTIGRVNGELLEGATLQLKIIECNQWLEVTKYYNSTAFDLWIPDEINKLSPIE